jgi:molybdopterin converting factor small subunit
MLSGSLPTGTVSTPDRRVRETADTDAVVESVDNTDETTDALRDELKRREREHRDVVRRYERLLDERDERIADLRSESDPSLRERVVARLDPRR